ncbi:MAG: type II toxin-antitoxin system antitoxin SocA domain-containing protein [archaeon]
MEAINFENVGNVRDIKLLKNLIKVILSNRGSLGKTEIVKLCFLIDKKYADTNKEPEGLTTTTYVKYFYGPYSEAFQKALEQLEQEGWIANEAESSILHKYEYVMKRKVESNLFNSDIPISVIKQVLEETRGKTLSDIKKIAYSYKEVKEAEFGKEIKLMWDNSNGIVSFSKMEKSI